MELSFLDSKRNSDASPPGPREAICVCRESFSGSGVQGAPSPLIACDEVLAEMIQRKCGSCPRVLVTRRDLGMNHRRGIVLPLHRARQCDEFMDGA